MAHFLFTTSISNPMKKGNIFTAFKTLKTDDKIFFGGRVLTVQCVYIKCVVCADMKGNFHTVSSENFYQNEVFSVIELKPHIGTFS